jgi:hypothetical protein
MESPALARLQRDLYYRRERAAAGRPTAPEALPTLLQTGCPDVRGLSPFHRLDDLRDAWLRCRRRSAVGRGAPAHVSPAAFANAGAGQVADAPPDDWMTAPSVLADHTLVCLCLLACDAGLAMQHDDDIVHAVAGFRTEVEMAVAAADSRRRTDARRRALLDAGAKSLDDEVIADDATGLAALAARAGGLVLLVLPGAAGVTPARLVPADAPPDAPAAVLLQRGVDGRYAMRVLAGHGPVAPLADLRRSVLRDAGIDVAGVTYSALGALAASLGLRFGRRPTREALLAAVAGATTAAGAATGAKAGAATGAATGAKAGAATGAKAGAVTGAAPT